MEPEIQRLISLRIAKNRRRCFENDTGSFQTDCFEALPIPPPLRFQYPRKFRIKCEHSAQNWARQRSFCIGGIPTDRKAWNT